MSSLLLTACASSAPAPMSLAASGPVEVMLGGVGFMADLQPLIGGAEISVSRQAGPFAPDEGLLAEAVAVQFCAARGQRLDPRALGSFAGGLWTFEEGCQ